MQTASKTTAILLTLIFVGIAFTSIAWQSNDHIKNRNNIQSDTIPGFDKKQGPAKDQTIINGDLNKTIEQVDRALENVQQQLENKDWEKAQEAMEKSLQKINTENIEKQIKNALKNIDAQKIQMQVQAELKKMDGGKMQQEIQRALEDTKNNFDTENAALEIQKALHESTTGLNELKKMNIEKINEVMNDARSSMKLALDKDFKKEMEKTRESMNRVKDELENYQEMLSDMEKDGLLHLNQDYKVELNKGELKINGKKQPAPVIEKYKHYFKKGKVTLEKEKSEDSNDKIIDI